MPTKKGGGNRNASRAQDTSVPGSDYIVFGDGKKEKKKKTDAPPQDNGQEPPKPTVKQIIGGASWTGKLPVTLLAEHCQRQKWNKPDYDLRTIPAKDGGEKMYRSAVTLARTDPKTREHRAIPALRLPAEHIQLSDRPSVLEAKHFAATYALFRVSSMKNIHMTLPPTYRDLWKGEFSSFKKDDVAEGRAWKYEEDPFAADVKRVEIQKSIEARKQQQEKAKQEEAESLAKGPALSLPWKNDAGVKKWEHYPKAEMGAQVRVDIERIIKRSTTWNPHHISITQQQQVAVCNEMMQLGFRESHVKEGLEQCKDRAEVLEWLMIHVPEADLPSWAMPSSYNAGVSLVSGDTSKQAKVDRLTKAGFPVDVCAGFLRQFDGNEHLAARALQAKLVPEVRQPTLDICQRCSVWDEEKLALEAIFGEKYSAPSEYECIIDVETNAGQIISLRIRCVSETYPSAEVPVITIEADGLPAHIKLSATRQAVLYAYEHLLGAAMVYDICQWLESSLSDIIKQPGRLSELANLSSPDDDSVDANTGDKTASNTPSRRNARAQRTVRIDRRTNAQIFDLYKQRLETAEQVKMISNRQKLPAWSKREQIISTIAKHRVTIVSGETGSGKSTQTIQFILDHAISDMQGASIKLVCTQPRRVAALSLADRVSAERCSTVGDEVGYVIRGESKTSDKTKITFMTTGVLLRWLQGGEGSKKALAGISHVFIDEVHERSLDTDFLLALLKDCLGQYPKLKVILMSATLDADVFISYFGGYSHVGQVEIEGRTFPVTDYFIDDVLPMIDPGSNYNDENIGRAIRSLGMGINYDLIRDLVAYVDHDLGEKQGSILIFLPGTLEIDRCLRAISSLTGIFGLPLHASLLPIEQRKVFQATPRGCRKIIAATNVAETSITIEDIVAVIDTGRVKETSYDPVNNIVRLQEVWASQSACKQRRGRAGRVRAGICYKLFTNNVEANMQAKPLPEIQRVPLEQLCLSIKATGSDKDVAHFLSQTLTPPRADAVSNAMQNLHIMGAMEDNRLTALGQYLALVPADLRCAKLLVYGILFDCIEPCLSIASILAVKSPFASPRDKRDEANAARISFPISHGDLMLDMAAFDEWTDMSHRCRPREIADWCSSKFLSQQTLRDIASTRRQLLDSLRDAGLVPLGYKTPSVLPSAIHNTHQCILLRALIAGALQPQIAVIQFPTKKYIASMSGAKELDPEAKTIKYFVSEDGQPDSPVTNPTIDATASTSVTKLASSAHLTSRSQATRVKASATSRIFVHPSSVLFTSQNFSHHATHLSFFGKVHTSKAFIRDLTPLNVYSLLFFGGALEIDTSGLGLVVAGTWRVRGWARIGVLISRLRALLDQEMRNAVEAQQMEAENASSLMGSMKDSRVVAVVRKLIELNGQDI